MSYTERDWYRQEATCPTCGVVLDGEICCPKCRRQFTVALDATGQFKVVPDEPEPAPKPQVSRKDLDFVFPLDVYGSDAVDMAGRMRSREERERRAGKQMPKPCLPKNNPLFLFQGWFNWLNG